MLEKLKSYFRNIEKPKEPHFFEKSYLINKTTEIAQKFKSGQISYDQTMAFLEKNYDKCDKESYDCHSFMLSVIKQEFGVNSTTAPNFQIPDRNQYEYGVDWQMDLKKEITKMMDTEKGQLYTNKLKQFTEELYENSDQIDIPKLELTINDDKIHSQQEQKIKDVARRALEKFSEGTKSRIILISDGENESFTDLHSAIILGINKEGTDLLVVEKREIGSEVLIKTLSEVISEYGYSFGTKTPKLSICKKPVREIYQ
jgi:hypothetical protein